ncbi:hypothetical protein BW730_08195 [Tessaracoccus aquimaris]|uniref:SWIM-type domain-containing protein n=1 Tax=Tessaracoccus aquimaris TaxID=1332264 RepID=A0A1Q2CMY7_9ACTN|nr:hypothetical protein [Tessaracoccus aquimaris]AQP47477.1 hypothetical protein BW730_08195 [Tessaracoccus aquimaris]
MSAWLAGWQAWDDAALEALANKGLVRRAAKAVPDAVLGDVTDDSAVVSTAGMDVVIGPRGPSEARCPCPATGVCVHVLTATMVARTQAPEGDGAGPSPLEDLLATTAEQWCREAGAATVRAALPSALEEAETEVTEVDGRVQIRWPGAPVVSYVPGQLLAGMSSTAPRQQWPALHLEAASRAVRATGGAWEWPRKYLDELEAGRRAAEPVDLLAEVRVELGSALVDGLADVGPASLRSLAEVGTRLRAARLPRLAGQVGVIGGQLEALAARSDATDEATVVTSIARAWAITEAMPHGWPAELTGRREESESQALDLLALGATWWQSDSGARGATVHLWDRTNARALTLTDGRGANLDPTFTRSLAAVRPWESTLAALLGSVFRLDQARFRPDGTLAPTGGRPAGVRAATHADLDAVAAAPPVDRVPDPFGEPRGAARVLRVQRFGSATVDEIGQSLVVPVESPDGAVTVLRAPATPSSRGRVERLRDLLSHGRGIEYLVAVPVVHQGRLCLDPVTVYLGTPKGSVKGFSVDFDNAVQPTKQNNWLRRQLALLTDRKVATRAPSGVEALTRDVTDLATDLATRGLRTAQASSDRLLRLASTADDLALATLAGHLRALAADPSPDRLVRVVTLTGMVRELSWARD